MATIILVLAGVGLFVYVIVRSGLSRGRPAAVQARLKGPGLFEFDIVGESNYQSALEAICGGRTEESAQHYTEAVLVLEDANPHDNQAVRVDIHGRTVGYLARKNAREYRKELARQGAAKATCICKAVIIGGWRRSATDVGHFGVKLDLPLQ